MEFKNNWNFTGFYLLENFRLYRKVSIVRKCQFDKCEKGIKK